MRDSIKSYVEERLRAGDTQEIISREVHDRFPHKIAGWGYVANITRKFKKEAQDEITGTARATDPRPPRDEGDTARCYHAENPAGAAGNEGDDDGEEHEETHDERTPRDGRSQGG